MSPRITIALLVWTVGISVVYGARQLCHICTYIYSLPILFAPAAFAQFHLGVQANIVAH